LTYVLKEEDTTLRGLAKHVVLPWVTFSSQSEFGKASQYWSTEVG
jgi:hypothetical protein